MEKVEAADSSIGAWLTYAKQLAHEVRHHLKEEGHFFQMAGKLLTDQQKTDLAQAYLNEFSELKADMSSALE